MKSLTISLSLLCVALVCSAEVGNNTAPPVQLYKVNSSQAGSFCILLQAGIRIHFNYTEDSQTATSFLDVPLGTNKTSSGVCSKANQTEQHLQMTFNSTTLTFYFNRTGKDGKNVALVSVTYSFPGSILPNVTSNDTYSATVKNLTQFECPAGKGFLCSSNTSIVFNHTTPLVKIDTVSLRVEAFRSQKTNGTTFNNDYTQCDADNRISNIVPIAVGAALGALILVVLIAYLVGRKRNQRGYETV